MAGARPVAQCVLLDSIGEPEPREALDRVCALAEAVDVVDLAWLRVTPWRERLAAHYDPADRRAELRDDVEDLGPPRLRVADCRA